MDGYLPLPPLPGRINRLNELAYDLWWSWNPRAREVFRDLDYTLWRFTDHNPVLLLHLIEPDRLAAASSEPQFLRLYDDAIAGLDVVREGAGTWWSHQSPGRSQPIAWITPQFALHQSLPAESSSFGILSGDFCKEASDLGVPLVGVGLMYPRGYGHQRLSADGWQQERYEFIDWSDAPIGPALCPDGTRCSFGLPLGQDPVRLSVWQVRTGRVTLFLLDTDLPQNNAWDRELSSRCFVDDPDSRVRQCVLLGAGAARALELLGYDPAVWHVADGAAGMVTLELLNRLVGAGTDFETALDRVARTVLFSTRESTPPRRDSFSFTALDRHLASVWPALATHRESVLALGRLETDRGGSFNVSVLGARASALTNAPERGSGEGAAAAWQELRGEDESATGVRSIPDGVHLATWISADLSRLLDHYVGADWRERQDDDAAWSAVRQIPDAEVWAVRQRLRGYLVDFIRERARRGWAREQVSGDRLVALGTLLDAGALTIGFARPFSAAARPDLLFQDTDRLSRILTAARRPVQLVIAGKAHPGDERGKHLLQRVFRNALDPSFGGRVAFVEDFDLHVARLLVQGCDVWLSTSSEDAPTSLGGIKAAVNGVPHLATAEAWWAAGCTGENGWVIDGGRARDAVEQDVADSRAIYRLVEEQIVPMFYDRARAGVPERWTAVVKEAIVTTLPRFCARRVVKAFADAAYLPAMAGEDGPVTREPAASDKD
jgi:starch phosphorylase